MRVKIKKRWWQLVTDRIKDNDTVFADADHNKRLIRINKILADKSQDTNRLETVIHEIFHGLFPYLDEDEIGSRAYELSKILIKLGARIEMPPTNRKKK